MTGKMVLQQVFPGEWEAMLKLYCEYIAECSQFNGRGISPPEALNFMELDARFACRATKMRFSRIIELGCGMAIPAIVISRLRRATVRALELDMAILKYAEALNSLCNTRVRLECRDYRFLEDEAEAGTVWICEKPRSPNPREDMESRVVSEAIRRRVSLALVPVFGPDPSVDKYENHCIEIGLKLEREGYTVESQRVHPVFPLRWIIAENG